MKIESVPTSDNYQDHLIESLGKNPQLAAAYLTATLEEENPEPALLLQALDQVYQALSAEKMNISHNLLEPSEARTIYKFVNLLQKIGLKIDISREE
jgi:hypothetical protein